MRATRDLLRRRLYLVRKRGELLAHIQNTHHQYNLPEPRAKIAYKANREGVAEVFDDPAVRKSIEVDFALIQHYDGLIKDLELHLERSAKQHDPDVYHRLRTIPGVGKILALTMLYEIHDIGRFPRVQQFLSYSRLVKCELRSAGKKTGSGGDKIGNAHLQWAFSEAAVLFLRNNERGQLLRRKLTRRHGKSKALSILAARLGRAGGNGQQDRAETWVRAQRQRLLPCSYFLLTFTVPDALRPLARAHHKPVYGLLLTCAAQALQKLARDPRYRGAAPGMMAVLHTWTRDLHYHPHAHFLVTAGGPSPDGQAWLQPKHPHFFVPGRVLSVLFRAKLRDASKEADLYDRVPRHVWRQKWVVHVQPAGRGHETLQYLGRYLFCTAIANSRLTRFENGRVTFRFRENGSGAMRQRTLSAEEFIRRFLQHVLPRGFTKLRHYGCFSPSCADKLERARGLLEAEAPSHAPAEDSLSASEIAQTPVGDNADDDSQDRRCPFCKTGRMRFVATLPKAPRRAFGARAPPGASP